VPLSADAEGSLGIKPRRNINAAAHGGKQQPAASLRACFTGKVPVTVLMSRSDASLNYVLYVMFT